MATAGVIDGSDAKSTVFIAELKEPRREKGGLEDFIALAGCVVLYLDTCSSSGTIADDIPGVSWGLSRALPGSNR